VDYGEAEAVLANGRRAWKWVADVPSASLVNSNEERYRTNVA
jgi:hypothetical protein